MARIEIILRDAEGKMINHKTQKQYTLNLSTGRIGEIEEAVEGVKRESLADMTYDVLAHAPPPQMEQIKKPNR